jgi:hypothetical protein
MQDQPRSVGGPITGSFEILDTGSGKHAGALQPLLGRVTNAAEILRSIRRDSPQCVHVVNANTLVVENA